MLVLHGHRRDVDVNAPDFKGCTSLHCAIKKPHVANVGLLLWSGAVVDTQDYRGMTPLLQLHNSDSKEMIKLLLQGNAIVNVRDDDGHTILSIAVRGW